MQICREVFNHALSSENESVNAEDIVSVSRTQQVVVEVEVEEVVEGKKRDEVVGIRFIRR
jgi:hypothetical protein